MGNAHLVIVPAGGAVLAGLHGVGLAAAEIAIAADAGVAPGADRANRICVSTIRLLRFPLRLDGAGSVWCDYPDPTPLASWDG